MIADAVEAVHVLMWALAGWIAAFAAVGSLLLLAVCAGVAWVWQVVRARAQRPRDYDTAA